MRALTNFDAKQPYKHAVYYVTLLISEKGWNKQQLLDCVNSFTVDDLQAFILERDTISSISWIFEREQNEVDEIKKLTKTQLSVFCSQHTHLYWLQKTMLTKQLLAMLTKLFLIIRSEGQHF